MLLICFYFNKKKYYLSLTIYLSGFREGPEGADPAVPVRAGEPEPGAGPGRGAQLPVRAGQRHGHQGPRVLPQHHPEDEGRVVQPGRWDADNGQYKYLKNVSIHFLVRFKYVSRKLEFGLGRNVNYEEFKW